MNKSTSSEKLELLTAILENAIEGVVVCNNEGELTYFNQRTRELHGLPLAPVPMEQWPSYYNIYRPDGETLMKPHEIPLVRALNEGIVKDVHMVIARKDQPPVHVLATGRALYSPEGKKLGAMVNMLDITQSLKIQEDMAGELNLERNRLDFLDHVTSLLLTTLDHNEIILQVASSAIPKVADGCIVDLVEGNKIRRLITRHQNPEIERLMYQLEKEFPPDLNSPHANSQVIRSGVPELKQVVDTETILDHTINPRHASLMSQIGLRSYMAVPMQIRGKIIGAISFIITSERPVFDENDLTLAVELSRRAAIAIENSRLFSEAQSASQQREDFISIASHELKTPITSLKLQLEAISRSISKSKLDRIDHEYLKKFSASSIRQLDRLTRLVEDMLDISRITTGKLALNMRVVDLSETVKEVILRFSDQLKEMKVELQSDISHDCIVYCDPFRIEQVIINLLSNALKYGLKKPIQVKLEKTDGKVIFSVTDNGPGIDPKDHDRIFLRFERGSDPLMAGGLGLGLYISREIIEQHEGKMTLTSQLGHGSTFSFSLPLENLN